MFEEAVRWEKSLGFTQGGISIIAGSLIAIVSTTPCDNNVSKYILFQF